MVQLAGQLEDEGQLEPAAEMYRAAMAAGGPTPKICFLLAELLYQMHDLPAARERYYMAVELDEDYVEARANLGCVLAELGEQELAIAAFEGALAYHDDYPDVHYHLARIAGRSRTSRARPLQHWEAFLRWPPGAPGPTRPASGWRVKLVVRKGSLVFLFDNWLGLPPRRGKGHLSRITREVRRSLTWGLSSPLATTSASVLELGSPQGETPQSFAKMGRLSYPSNCAREWR